MQVTAPTSMLLTASYWFILVVARNFYDKKRNKGEQKVTILITVSLFLSPCIHPFTHEETVILEENVV